MPPPARRLARADVSLGEYDRREPCSDDGSDCSCDFASTDMLPLVALLET